MLWTVTPGALIRTIRKRHQLTQRELAARAGTTQSAISRIESDRVSPTFDTLHELAFLMGEELDFATKPVDWGHDLDMLRENLDLSQADRINRGIAFSRFALESRGSALRAGR